MRVAALYAPGDIRFEARDEPKIIKPTDTIIRTSVTCICGSDLWPYRGINPITQPSPMGHEYCGIVEEVGSAVKSIKPGQFVIGSFFTSDNTCPNCQIGYQSSCQQSFLYFLLVAADQAAALRGMTFTVADRARSPIMASGMGWFCISRGKRHRCGR